jgi:hypothetical protein
MALSSTIAADFSEFVGECQKADRGLEAIQTQAGQTEQALTAMGDRASTGKLTQSLSQTNQGLQDIHVSATSVWNTVKGMAGAFGIAFSVDAVIGFGKSLLDTADQLVKVSDQTGITIEDVQRLSYIAEQSGNTLDELTSAASKLQATLGDKKVAEAVSALGLSVEDLRAADPFTMLQLIAEGFAGIPDPAKRAEIAYDLFGRAGAKIMPTLIADWKTLGAEVVASSAAQVKAIDAAGDALSRFGTKVKNAAVGAAGSMILAGEQIMSQGLLKTYKDFVGSATPVDFLQKMAAMRTATVEQAGAQTQAAAGVRDHAAALPPTTAAVQAQATATTAAVTATRAHGAAQREAMTDVRAHAAAQREAAQATEQQAAATLRLPPIVAGLGAAWASVGERISIATDKIVGDITRQATAAAQAAAAYEAETQRQADAWNRGERAGQGYAASTRQVAQETAQTTQQIVQLNAALGQNATAYDAAIAGAQLLKAYADAGVATSGSIGLGGYDFKQLQQTGVPGGWGGVSWANRTPTPPEAWGRGGATQTTNTLNVNVNSTDAQDIANKLVTEMRHSGVRF